jgi:type IV fimbrial biogenesis protein FimT
VAYRDANLRLAWTRGITWGAMALLIEATLAVMLFVGGQGIADKTLTKYRDEHGANFKVISFFLNIPFIYKYIPSVKPPVLYNMPFAINGNYKRGFTLIEMIVTLTIAGILIAFAAPAMRDFILNQRLATQANDFIGDLNLARSEAIRRATNVTVCKQGGTPASPSCGISAAWSAGRVVFVDTDSDGQLDLNETVLRVRESLDGNNTLNSIGTTTNSIVFASTGLTTLTTGMEVTMRFCDSRGPGKAVTLFINYTGRARIDQTAAASCS